MIFAQSLQKPKRRIKSTFLAHIREPIAQSKTQDLINGVGFGVFRVCCNILGSCYNQMQNIQQSVVIVILDS